jgi:hypothetical protein
VRVALRMIEVATGYQSWSGRWDVAPEEVLGVQDAAAQAITGALSPGASAPVRAAPEDPEAVALYLRAKQRATSSAGRRTRRRSTCSSWRWRVSRTTRGSRRA